MAVKLQMRPGLIDRLRVARDIPSEEIMARMVGVDRGTLRQVKNGDQPSGTCIAEFVTVFGMGIGEAFIVVDTNGKQVLAAA
ncbi:helix-turn-helix domain-containing protein [Leucobacter sp. 1207-22]|uniref:helix-turn-helix domain-containing protein n=1 Tax=Leucobacter sp. 1207-22 TaxID=2604456 RepID=UPI0040629913